MPSSAATGESTAAFWSCLFTVHCACLGGCKIRQHDSIVRNATNSSRLERSRPGQLFQKKMPESAKGVVDMSIHASIRPWICPRSAVRISTLQDRKRAPWRKDIEAKCHRINVQLPENSVNGAVNTANLVGWRPPGTPPSLKCVSASSRRAKRCGSTCEEHISDGLPQHTSLDTTRQRRRHRRLLQSAVSTYCLLPGSSLLFGQVKCIVFQNAVLGLDWG